MASADNQGYCQTGNGGLSGSDDGTIRCARWKKILIPEHRPKAAPRWRAFAPAKPAYVTSMAATWMQRLKRVFGIDIETCPACGGAVRIIACIEDAAVIEKILTHLDEKDAAAEASRQPRCRAPPQAGLFD